MMVLPEPIMPEAINTARQPCEPNSHCFLQDGIPQSNKNYRYEICPDDMQVLDARVFWVLIGAETRRNHYRFYGRSIPPV
jgi:hypothetical protein